MMKSRAAQYGLVVELKGVASTAQFKTLGRWKVHANELTPEATTGKTEGLRAFRNMLKSLQ